MFQFSDISDVSNGTQPPNEPLDIGPQPEEEPSRRISTEAVPGITPEEIAIPDISERAWDHDSVQSPSAPETRSGVNDNEIGDNSNGDRGHF